MNLDVNLNSVCQTNTHMHWSSCYVLHPTQTHTHTHTHCHMGSQTHNTLRVSFRSFKKMFYCHINLVKEQLLWHLLFYLFIFFEEMQTHFGLCNFYWILHMSLRCRRLYILLHLFVCFLQFILKKKTRMYF